MTLSEILVILGLLFGTIIGIILNFIFDLNASTAFVILIGSIVLGLAGSQILYHVSMNSMTSGSDNIENGNNDDSDLQ